MVFEDFYFVENFVGGFGTFILELFDVAKISLFDGLTLVNEFEGEIWTVLRLSSDPLRVRLSSF